MQPAEETSNVGASDPAATSISDSSPIELLLSELATHGVEESLIDKLGNLLKSCTIRTVGAIRRFRETTELVAQLYDTSTTMGRLQSEGLVAAIHVCLSINQLHTTAVPTD